MEDTRASVSLNLSNQANIGISKKSTLFQFNCFVILGLDCLESRNGTEAGIPISILIDNSGEMTIQGLDTDMVTGEKVSIYSDRKVTSSSG